MLTKLVLGAFLCSALGAFAQEYKGYYSLAIEGGGGYFANWDYYEEDDLQLLGLYTHDDKAKLGYSFQVGASRHSKRGKLVYGLSFYRWQATGRYTREYRRGDGSLFVYLEEVSVSEAGNVFLARIEPRLLAKESWSLSAYGAAGLSYLQDENITVPVGGNGPTIIRTRRNSNANYMELHTQLGVTGTFYVNPYYQLFARLRGNYELSTTYLTLLEVSAGLQLTFGGGARDAAALLTTQDR